MNNKRLIKVAFPLKRASLYSAARPVVLRPNGFVEVWKARVGKMLLLRRSRQ